MLPDAAIAMIHNSMTRIILTVWIASLLLCCGGCGAPWCADSSSSATLPGNMPVELGGWVCHIDPCCSGYQETHWYQWQQCGQVTELSAGERKLEAEVVPGTAPKPPPAEPPTPSPLITPSNPPHSTNAVPEPDAAPNGAAARIQRLPPI